MRYYLSIGSNMGNPIINIKNALKKIEEEGIFVEKSSSLYLTEPVCLKEQDWFVNFAISVKTGFEPIELLTKIKDIEKAMGRKNYIMKGPRPIDIDIVLMDFPPFSFECKSLSIPHKSMHLRKFVLLPLSEICPFKIHPFLKKSILQLLRDVQDESEVYPMIG
ncbi:MAG: 2-amino-4-hydroxy-6-hydroxymethyldihydropteridine diphosphokinase [Candidatus Aminicenantia bacterium]